MFAAFEPTKDGQCIIWGTGDTESSAKEDAEQTIKYSDHRDRPTRPLVVIPMTNALASDIENYGGVEDWRWINPGSQLDLLPESIDKMRAKLKKLRGKLGRPEGKKILEEIVSMAQKLIHTT